jgi:Major Facilitator Superfamily
MYFSGAVSFLSDRKQEYIELPQWPPETSMAESMDLPSSEFSPQKNMDSKDAFDESLNETTLGESVVLIDPHAERKLVWKFDTRILPVLATMYLFNSLDKSNLGNAKTDGLETTLNLTGDQYNIILSVFFIPYVLTAPFLGIMGKKYGPNRVLPVMMFCFGVVTTMVVVVQNFGGLMTIRWFLGMAESAFFPLVIYYQTTYSPLKFC